MDDLGRESEKTRGVGKVGVAMGMVSKAGFGGVRGGCWRGASKESQRKERGKR